MKKEKIKKIEKITQVDIDKCELDADRKYSSFEDTLNWVAKYQGDINSLCVGKINEIIDVLNSRLFKGTHIFSHKKGDNLK